MRNLKNITIMIIINILIKAISLRVKVQIVIQYFITV